eukprot:TRINITY_DN30158_c0_g1_i1.p1 TRINITY_DN30158_c0_g1~~TRINITY_DN30158_c0_g1_i1.p1  ORF type:complete len:124 (-),score=11.66 TRINITY_DN30158_c0_g1_i1:28-399(-)
MLGRLSRTLRTRQDMRAGRTTRDISKFLWRQIQGGGEIVEICGTGRQPQGQDEKMEEQINTPGTQGAEGRQKGHTAEAPDGSSAVVREDDPLKAGNRADNATQSYITTCELHDSYNQGCILKT